MLGAESYKTPFILEQLNASLRHAEGENRRVAAEASRQNGRTGRGKTIDPDQGGFRQGAYV